MRNLRARGPVALAASAVLVATGCGGHAAARGRTTIPPRTPAASAPADPVDQLVAARARAALAGDRQAVAATERRLDRLARRQPARMTGATGRGPFGRMLDAFRFKQAPLFVLQNQTTGGSHVLFSRVDRAAFCLQTPAARLAAVRRTYAPLDRGLRRHRVRDFVWYVVPIGTRAATPRGALAIGRGGRAALTTAGRTC